MSVCVWYKLTFFLLLLFLGETCPLFKVGSKKGREIRRADCIIRALNDDPQVERFFFVSSVLLLRQMNSTTLNLEMDGRADCRERERERKGVARTNKESPF